MKKFLLAVAATILLAGCGDPVSIPANYKAAVVDSDYGVDDSKTYSGIVYTIPFGWVERDSLLAAETNQSSYSFTANVPINASNGLPVTFGFNVVYQLRDDKDSFSDALTLYRSERELEFLRVIRAEEMAKTTLQPIAVDTASNTINGLKLTIEDIMLNMPKVRDEVRKQFDKVLADTPLMIISLTADNPAWPESVIERKEERQRIIDDEQIQIERLAMEKRQLDKEHAFALIKADKDLELDEKYATRYNGENGGMLLKQQVVEILDKCADNEKGCNIVLTEGLSPWKD